MAVPVRSAVPVGVGSGGGNGSAVAAPRPAPVSSVDDDNTELTIEDFDDIDDFFCWDSPFTEKFDDAFCLFEGPYARPIAGTPVGAMVRALVEQIYEDPLHREASLIDFQQFFKYTDAKGEDREVVFRCHRDMTVQGRQLCIRRVKETVPTLYDLSFPPYWREVMLSDTLNEGGLVVLASKPGSGKSTTIAAMLRSRLEKFGGFCKTVEAPPEYPLQNSWGRGVCFQIPVDETLPREEQFARPLRGLLRGYPAIPGGGRTILMVGEVRDPETAAEVLQQSVGHLVVTTTHALDIHSAMQRIAGLAGRILGDNVAREMLASAVRLVINQRLERVPSAANGERPSGWRRRIATGQLIYSSGGHTDIGNNIREGKWESLVGVESKQRTRLELAAASNVNVERALADLSPPVNARPGAV